MIFATYPAIWLKHGCQCHQAVEQGMWCLASWGRSCAAQPRLQGLALNPGASTLNPEPSGHVEARVPLQRCVWTVMATSSSFVG